VIKFLVFYFVSRNISRFLKYFLKIKNFVQKVKNQKIYFFAKSFLKFGILGFQKYCKKREIFHEA